ncbi:hypothetical protein K8P10_002678 [Leucobacter sp. Psy1]|uniref:TRAP transporter small permease n=1 Tax=Leucobacter sp. Psy1 TaxID=2875729 RepID=UPI001CD2CA4F|nr:TRAP transporter small permease [Leucobacter sp. Psy1]UBH07167.1 hypothetical protein K8P10_002678 [Leucobacter sp. Psy1]
MAEVDSTERAPSPPPEPAVLRWLSKFELALAVFFLAMIFIGVIWQVLGRYIGEVNWPGAGEIARYSLMGLTFIVVGYLIGNNGQITVAVIDSVVTSRRGRMVVRLVSSVLLTIVCVWLAWEAFSLVDGGFRRTTAVLQIPMGYLFLIPLLGFLSGTVRSVERIVRARYEQTDAITIEDAEE